MIEGLFDLPDTDSERQLRAVVEALRQHPRWQPDEVADRRFAADLLTEYPTTDLVAEIGKWRAHMQAHEPGPEKEVRLIARLRRWLRNDREWRAGSSRRKVGDGVRRAGSRAPRGPADFAGEDGQARSW